MAAVEGGAGFTIRRIADAAGTSTMAIYTHFGGVDGLRHAVRREGFARFATRLGDVTDTADPVADLSLLGLTYFGYAVDESDLYRVMFLERVVDEVDEDIGWETFAVLVRGVQRCLDAGRFRDGDAEHVATQLWSMAHGTVSLHLAGLLSAPDAITAMGATALHIYVGCGDRADRAAGSLQRALERADLPAAQDPRVTREHRWARRRRLSSSR